MNTLIAIRDSEIEEACNCTECEATVTHRIITDHPNGDIYLCAHHARCADDQGYEPVALCDE